MKEYKIQIELVSYIKNNFPMIKPIYIKNETIGGAKQKSIVTKMGLFKGVPDLLLIAPNGNLMFLELKSKGMKPRKDQKEVHEILTSYGFKVDWADSFQDAKIIVLKWIKEFIN